MKIGINGFGRIGKSLFLQLLFDSTYDFELTAINAIHLSIDQIENYLKYDSTHHYNKDFQISICEENKSYFIISYKNKSHKIKLWSTKDTNIIDWSVDILFEASGAFLTTVDCLKHKNVKKVIITAPTKDDTNTFVYGVNHENYNNEHIISCASCTTTCISPFLKFMDSNYTINNASFTTIHASTSSQYVLDTPILSKKSGRSVRSIFNNLIPATTGASSAIKAILPKLEGKIHGLAIRVPTNNVSLVDLTIECIDEYSINEICNKIDVMNSIIMKVEKNELVSSDFQTSSYCTIIDKPSMIQLSKNKCKVLIWYDNEWSYSTQCINMSKYIYEKEFKIYENKQYHFINDYVSFKDKNVLMRVDYNVPLNKDDSISDDFRITSTLESINRVLKDKPNRIILSTHFGRPKLNKSNEENKKYSTQFLVSYLEEILKKKVHFLPSGLSFQTYHDIKMVEKQNYLYSLYELDEDFSPRLLTNTCDPSIFLLENLRFHNDETHFENPNFNKETSEAYIVWNNLGNVFVNCAFGCSHRNHLSMYGFKPSSGPIYYDYLMEREIKALEEITVNCEDKRILTILGGAKIDDKLPLCNALLSKINHIYLGGGIINSYIYNEDHKAFIETLELNKKTFLMNDGYGNSSLQENNGKYLQGYTYLSNHYYYDIGTNSLNQLYELIDKNDIIFWNGTMGVVEHELYKAGSEKLLDYLLNSGKRIIIGGGDTASFVNNYIKKRENMNLKNVHICTGGGASIEYIIKGKLGFY